MNVIVARDSQFECSDDSQPAKFPMMFQPASLNGEYKIKNMDADVDGFLICG